MPSRRLLIVIKVHKQCQRYSERILKEFKPDLMIAIGGGGYVPARILRYASYRIQQAQRLTQPRENRSFLKQPGAPNIPIQAISLSLYEKPSLPNEDVVEEVGTKVTRTQWLDPSSLHTGSLIGKNILIVDEVDDTRTTLEYAVRELEKDVETAKELLRRGDEKTRFYIFVLHNKNKEKKGRLPNNMEKEGKYLAAKTTGDVWICYPWEATDIDVHDELAKVHGLED
jgi:uncharacterized protein